MTAVHNSNPDVGRECIDLNLLNKYPTCLGLKRRPKGIGGRLGKGNSGFATPRFPFPPTKPHSESGET